MKKKIYDEKIFSMTKFFEKKNYDILIFFDYVSPIYIQCDVNFNIEHIFAFSDPIVTLSFLPFRWRKRGKKGNKVDYETFVCDRQFCTKCVLLNEKKIS